MTSGGAARSPPDSASPTAQLHLGEHAATGGRGGGRLGWLAWTRGWVWTAAGSRWSVPVLWGSLALIALATMLVTSSPAHRVWAGGALLGYGAAALVSVGWAWWAATTDHRPVREAGLLPPVPGVATGCAVLGSVVGPMLVLTTSGVAQPEVGVTEDAGRLLVTTGTPYLADPTEVYDHNPYLPAMAVFGLPRVLLGSGVAGDPRWWFAVFFLGTLALAVRVAGGGAGRLAGSAGYRLLPVLLCCPLVALPLAVGGVDLPMIGLTCLSLALASRGRAGWAGLAAGLAVAVKWMAVPALVVTCALLAGRFGARRALVGALVAVGAVVAVTMPPLLVDPSAFASHVLRFPLGLAEVSSPAASPLPGHLLATLVPGGPTLSLGLLGLAAFLLGLRTLRRPPRDLGTAVPLLAAGLTVAVLLMPATRFGYLAYPVALLLFPLACPRRAVPSAPPRSLTPAGWWTC